MEQGDRNIRLSEDHHQPGLRDRRKELPVGELHGLPAFAKRSESLVAVIRAEDLDARFGNENRGARHGIAPVAGLLAFGGFQQTPVMLEPGQTRFRRDVSPEVLVRKIDR